MFVMGTVWTNVSIITKINYICTTIDFALYFNIYTFMIDIHITLLVVSSKKNICRIPPQYGTRYFQNIQFKKDYLASAKENQMVIDTPY